MERHDESKNYIDSMIKLNCLGMRELMKPLARQLAMQLNGIMSKCQERDLFCEFWLPQNHELAMIKILEFPLFPEKGPVMKACSNLTPAQGEQFSF